LSDPEVLSLIARQFVPVAVDVGSVRPDWKFIPHGTSNYTPEHLGDREKELFAAIEKQDPQSQGIWLTTPDGKVLRSSYHVSAQPMLAMMEAAIADWKRLGGTDPLPIPPSVRCTGPCLEPLPGTVRLTFHGRLVTDSSHPPEPLRDTLDVSEKDFEELLAREPQPGQTHEVPARLMQSWATRLYSGEMRLAVRPEEIRSAHATVTIEEVGQELVTGQVQGAIELDGVVPLSTRRRLLHSELTGTLQWRLDSRELQTVRIVCDGMWQAEYPGGIPAVSLDIYPGGASPEPLRLCPPLRMLFLIEYVRPDAASAAPVTAGNPGPSKAS
jgi:hypothetical protein